MSNIILEMPETTQPETTQVDAAESQLLATKSEIIAEVDKTFKELETLPPEDQAHVEDFVSQINLHSRDMILRYGEKAQRKLETFTDSTLKNVTGRDVGEVGDLLCEMSTSIKDFNGQTESKFFGALQSVAKRAEKLRVKYSEVSETLERVKKDLLRHRTTLIVDIKQLDEMYQQNLDYYKELTMYILAGKLKLEETRNGELKELEEKAKFGTQEDAFAFNDLQGACENFEKQLYDLELTRAVCLQTAPQIRLVQQADEQLARKIQSSINNTIPIWKQKIAVAIAIQHNQDASKMQREVTDLTSKMLEDTAKKLHTSVVDAAKESERGIIKVEAIIASNTELLAAIDDVLNIQEEGRKARAEAEIQLQKAEEELKQKLVGASQQKS